MNLYDGERGIKLADRLLFALWRHAQRRPAALTAGGILMGQENISNNYLLIKWLTGPGEKDEYGRRFCFRLDQHHEAFFNKLYERHKQTVRYVGEWYTQHEAVPMYTAMDLRNWRRILSELPDEIESFYHIIVGYKAFRLWRADRQSDLPHLVTTVYWTHKEKAE